MRVKHAPPTPRHLEIQHCDRTVGAVLKISYDKKERDKEYDPSVGMVNLTEQLLVRAYPRLEFARVWPR